MTKQQIKQTKYDDFDLDGPLEESIVILQEKLEELKKEGYKNIEFSCRDSYANLEATKERDETDEEYENRTAKEDIAQKKRRAQYELLKKEFG